MIGECGHKVVFVLLLTVVELVVMDPWWGAERQGGHRYPGWNTGYSRNGIGCWHQGGQSVCWFVGYCIMLMSCSCRHYKVR